MYGNPPLLTTPCMLRMYVYTTLAKPTHNVAVVCPSPFQGMDPCCAAAAKAQALRHSCAKRSAQREHSRCLLINHPFRVDPRYAGVALVALGQTQQMLAPQSPFQGGPPLCWCSIGGFRANTTDACSSITLSGWTHAMLV